MKIKYTFSFSQGKLKSNISYLLGKILYLFIYTWYIFHQKLKRKVFFSFIDYIVEEELKYSSDKKYETFENVQSATAKRSHRRDCLTYKRKVNSIESSLDESNYNLFIVPAETAKIIAQFPSKPTNNKKTKEKVVFTN